jgi:hypothetical protein
MRPSLRGIVWSAWGIVALLLAASVIFYLHREPEQTAPQPAAAMLPPAPESAPAAAREATPPSFDIVSVERDGRAVIAGRALPGDRVRVLAIGAGGATPLGEVVADARGEWVLVPETPIAAGDHQLGLEAVAADGGQPRRSPDIVALSVMPSGSARDEAATLAVLLPGTPGAPARLLQKPREPAGDREPSLDMAEFGGSDELVLTGSAAPGARLNIYAGDRLLGGAIADAAGKWTLRSAYRPPPGGVELRLDQLAADGSSARRIAARFEMPGGDAAGRGTIGAGDTYIVARGNSLWLIARRVYGQGMRYTAIYAANRETISDPHRIYPGQALKLPRP